jgi:hypothetical protein
MEKNEARCDFLVYLVSAVWSAFCGICAYDMNDDENAYSFAIAFWPAPSANGSQLACYLFIG